MTIAQVLQCKANRQINSNTIQAHYELHTHNVNVKCQFVINDWCKMNRQ